MERHTADEERAASSRQVQGHVLETSGAVLEGIAEAIDLDRRSWLRVGLPFCHFELLEVRAQEVGKGMGYILYARTLKLCESGRFEGIGMSHHRMSDSLIRSIARPGKIFTLF